MCLDTNKMASLCSIPPYTSSPASSSQKEAVLKPEACLGLQKHRRPVPYFLSRDSFTEDPVTIKTPGEKNSSVSEFPYRNKVCICLGVCVNGEGPEKFYLNKF